MNQSNPAGSRTPARANAPWHRRVLFSLVPTLVLVPVLILLLELVARGYVWYWSVPLEFRPQPFQELGQTDPVLWWVLQPDLNAEMGGVRLRTNRWGFRDERDQFPANALRIFCLGDSTTFGWRVQPDQMYSAILEQLLKDAADQPVMVVSAGVPGYSSYQTMMQLRDKILAFQPHWISVLSSNNECRARSMGDRERGARISRQRSRDQAMRFSHLYRLLVRGSDPLRRTWETDPAPGRVANDLGEYASNVQELIGLARNHRCGVVVLSVPLRLRFNPSWRIYDRPGEEAAELIRRATVAIRAEEVPERVVPFLEQAVRLEPRQFTGHFLLAELYRQLGREQDAMEQFALARDGDLHPETAKPSYNRILQELCAIEQVPLINLDQRFTESGCTDAELFLDHCHPSPAGHRIIAESLARELTGAIAAQLPEHMDGREKPRARSTGF